MLDSQVVAPPSLQVMGGRYMPESGREVIYETNLNTNQCTYRADKHDPNVLAECLLNMLARSRCQTG